jgi:hypothetical protein
MITQNIKKQIISIWQNYVTSNREIEDTKGNLIEDINGRRFQAITDIKIIIDDFLKSNIDVHEFKTNLDSYNKQNNLWGFTAVKGQMFFNQLVRTAEDINSLTVLIKKSIVKPVDINEALNKIDKLEGYCQTIFTKAKDKRKAPNPKSVGYFLSYFWQIWDPEQWPILYSSMIVSFAELGIWSEPGTQKEAYERFYNLNEEVKTILKELAGKHISNWDAEHCFWNHKKITSTGGPKSPKPIIRSSEVVPEDAVTTVAKANFDIYEYLIPKVAKLVEVGKQVEKGSSAKGSEFEKLVGEVFKQIGFEVQSLGQGTGRNPDAIIKYKEDHTAFIVDAKAYLDGYVMGRDDRAIREYISYYCPILKKEGFTKIGFIIVCNSFKSDLDEFINEITWQTDIKRFKLITSEALLHFLAFKGKDETITLSSIVESVVNSKSNIISAESVIEVFEDI